TGYGAAAILLDRKAGRELTAWVVPVLGIVATFFSMLVVFVASPFHTQLASADGAGLNPSLQSFYFQIHPPLLYLGYVGLTVPFAFAMGALLSGRTDERWIVATRRWTLLAWAFLGIGQLLGAKWAYEEVGWGGYYAWDPVENAALMPWLAATAFLHSVMVQERKGMLKVWNMLLVILAFSLSLFGTFLTRSGVLNSIHSFTEGSIGPWFLGFICFVLACSLLLVFKRLPLLRSKTKLESLASREATFLYNNLLLVSLCLTILWGVMFPILSEAVRGESVTVGRPYYDFFLRAFGLPLLLLMGIGPLIAWRRASLRSLGRTFLWPFVTALVAGAGLIAAGAGTSIPGLIAYTFSAFVAATIALEFIRGTQARRALSGEAVPRAFGQLIARNRRRYGGYIVHAAILMLAIGIAGSSAYDTSHSARLAPGDSMKLRNYTLVYRGLNSKRSQNAIETRAAIDVYRGGDRIATMHPGKNDYPIEQQISNEVSIRSDWLTGEDLFLITEQVNQNGTIDFKAIINPLVNLIWAAGLVFLLGSAIALWPDAREERRLAVRYGRLPQEA
ncbi:MAG TPA: cytochrome c-type biogenesis CcmF C-terminal domain-containing protein, partial [Gaiellaceae bacterium]|nr:cytochrome c-type biogenesis CcmF C-terminal domain-containing protein [Gaiellaceae bacterium]